MSRYNDKDYTFILTDSGTTHRVPDTIYLKGQQFNFEGQSGNWADYIGVGDSYGNRISINVYNGGFYFQNRSEHGLFERQGNLTLGDDIYAWGSKIEDEYYRFTSDMASILTGEQFDTLSKTSQRKSKTKVYKMKDFNEYPTEIQDAVREIFDRQGLFRNIVQMERVAEVYERGMARGYSPKLLTSLVERQLGGERLSHNDYEDALTQGATGEMKELIDDMSKSLRNRRKTMKIDTRIGKGRTRKSAIRKDEEYGILHGRKYNLDGKTFTLDYNERWDEYDLYLDEGKDFPTFIGTVVGDTDESDVEDWIEIEYGKYRDKHGEVSKSKSLNKSKGIRLKGYNGTWKVIKRAMRKSEEIEQMRVKVNELLQSGKTIVLQGHRRDGWDVEEFSGESDIRDAMNWLDYQNNHGVGDIALYDGNGTELLTAYSNRQYNDETDEVFYKSRIARHPGIRKYAMKKEYYTPISYQITINGNTHDFTVFDEAKDYLSAYLSKNIHASRGMGEYYGFVDEYYGGSKDGDDLDTDDFDVIGKNLAFNYLNASAYQLGEVEPRETSGNTVVFDTEMPLSENEYKMFGELIYGEVFDSEIVKSKSPLTKSKGIRLRGYNGTWKVIKSRGQFSLLESEQMGKKALNIVLKGKKILKETDADTDRATKEFFGNNNAEKCSSKTEKADDVEEDVVEEDEQTKKSKIGKRRFSKEESPKSDFKEMEHPGTDDKINGMSAVSDDDGKPDVIPEETEMPSETALPDEMLNHEELEEINSTEDSTQASILDLDPSDAIDKMRNHGMTLSDLRDSLRKQDLGSQSAQVNPSGYPYARIGDGKLSNVLHKPTGQVRKF